MIGTSGLSKIPRRGGRGFGFWRISCGVWIGLAQAVASQTTSVQMGPAPATPDDSTAVAFVRTLEVGAGYGSFSDDLGEAHGQFGRFTLEKPEHYRWQLEVGTQSRFGDSSLGFGTSFTSFLSGDASMTIGFSTGTGEFLAPDYRVDISASVPILTIVVTPGYAHEQSKAENRLDSFTVGLQRWFPHWILDAFGRYDIGYPGETISRSAGFGITYYVWQKTYLGAGIEFGDISYMLISLEEVLVDYESTGYRLGLSQWFNESSGVNIGLDYGETPFYEVVGVNVSYFKIW